MEIVFKHRFDFEEHFNLGSIHFKIEISGIIENAFGKLKVIKISILIGSRHMHPQSIYTTKASEKIIVNLLSRHNHKTADN